MSRHTWNVIIYSGNRRSHTLKQSKWFACRNQHPCAWQFQPKGKTPIRWPIAQTRKWTKYKSSRSTCGREDQREYSSSQPYLVIIVYTKKKYHLQIVFTKYSFVRHIYISYTLYNKFTIVIHIVLNADIQST